MVVDVLLSYKIVVSEDDILQILCYSRLLHYYTFLMIPYLTMLVQVFVLYMSLISLALNLYKGKLENTL
jgi:hypothetical protein